MPLVSVGVAPGQYHQPTSPNCSHGVSPADAISAPTCAYADATYAATAALKQHCDDNSVPNPVAVATAVPSWNACPHAAGGFTSSWLNETTHPIPAAANSANQSISHKVTATFTGAGAASSTPHSTATALAFVVVTVDVSPAAAGAVTAM